MQKGYTSSISGAVGGAILFGPLGAMVGGRAKQKTSKVVTYYLVVTYQGDNEDIKYISFEVTNDLKNAKALISQVTAEGTTAPREVSL